VPEYKLGNIAQQDLITPVALEVVNPDATDALKSKEAAKVPMMFRLNTHSAADAETALREAFRSARNHFMDALRLAMKGKNERASNTGASLFDRAVEAARLQVNGFPLLDDLAPVWSRNGSDEELQALMVKLLREALSHPVLAQQDEAFRTQGPARLIPVESLAETPTQEDADQRGQIVPGDQLLSLAQARDQVRTHLPAHLTLAASYLALFVRPNVQPDPALTETVRARRTANLAALDSYPAGQIIVRRGQVIDRGALVALAALRGKAVIGTLQENSELAEREDDGNRLRTAWVVAGGAPILLAGLGAAAWRLRSRRKRSNWTAPTQGAPLELVTDATWRYSTTAPETKADQTREAMRAGMLQWMRERVVQGLFRQRADLLAAQQRAELEMGALAQRLEQLQAPLQERIAAYEQRILELERELASRGEENRELIKARITLARHQLDVERNRTATFGSN
jgi:hypothetical protein